MEHQYSHHTQESGIEESQRNYYAIIPAAVRYDKRLKLGARLLYGELTALSNERGYCWANNRYFADLYDASITTVSRWIKQLQDFGYIKTEITYKKDSKEIQQRNIFLVFAALDTPTQKRLYPIGKNDYTPKQKCLYPIGKNAQDNNTSINNTINNNNKVSEMDFAAQNDALFEADEVASIPAKKPVKKFVKPTLAEIEKYCLEKNLTKVDAEVFFDFYESKGWKIGRATMKDWHATVRNWNRRQISDEQTKSKPKTAYDKKTEELRNFDFSKVREI